MVAGSWRAQCDLSRAYRATLRSCSVLAATPSAASTATRVVSATDTCWPVQSAYRVAIPNRFASSTSEGASSVMPPILLPAPGRRRGGRSGPGDQKGKAPVVLLAADLSPHSFYSSSRLVGYHTFDRTSRRCAVTIPYSNPKELGRGISWGVQKVPAQWCTPLPAPFATMSTRRWLDS